MPTVNGIMYPAAREQLHSFNELNVLILGGVNPDLLVFFERLRALHQYISEVSRSNIIIRLHATSAFDRRIANNYGITYHNLKPINESSIQELAKETDIDIVFNQQDILSMRFARNNFYVFQTVNTMDELTRSCEDFLIGHGITWLFSGVTWNMPLLMKYFDKPGICRDFFSFMGECTRTKNYTSAQQDKVRYIANRIGQIEYSRDILHAYLKRKRKAERNGYEDQDFHFELNYHLGNYYFLIVGALDSMSRLLNDVLRLGLTRHSSLGLEKVAFVNANRRKRTGCVRILTNREFAEWLSFLKERRNFIAHDGDMRQSPIVEPNDIPLSDEEVERIVDGQMDWAFSSTIHTPDLIQSLRVQAAQMVRIRHDYTEVAKNAMIVPNDNGYKIYYPLPSIDHEYEQLEKILSKLLDRLKR